MRIILTLCIVALAISQVYAHSVLTVPTPWNTNPSKADPCGGGTAPNQAVYTYCKGKTGFLEWKVIAADGRGDISVAIDPNGGTNFNTQVELIQPTTPNAETAFGFTFNVPDVTCANNKCTMQVKSNSNWFSCATINIADSCENDEKQLVTAMAEDLKFCGEYVNDHRVMIPLGQTPQQMDATVKGTYLSNIANPLVFKNNGTACRKMYSQYLCQYNFPLDPGSDKDSGPIYENTPEECENMNNDCINTLHIGLYPCNPNSASSMVPSIVMAVVSVVAVMIML